MDISEKELNELISGCMNGKRSCQKKIYELFNKKMLYVCLRYSNDMSSAKDLMHDGFIKIFDKVENYNFSGSFEGWIRRIMVNNAIDQIRKNQKETIMEDDSYIFANMEGEEEEEDSLYDALNLKPQDVMDAVQQLSPAYKAVFNMYVIENFTHKEIADYLDISEGASKSNLAKAKRNLRQILSEKIKTV